MNQRTASAAENWLDLFCMSLALDITGRETRQVLTSPMNGLSIRNHAAGIASIDLLAVSTNSFKLLHGLVVMSHARRRLVRIAVTFNPTAE